MDPRGVFCVLDLESTAARLLLHRKLNSIIKTRSG